MGNTAVEINQITEKIIGCAYKVSNTLGAGFLEKVYENALAYELTKSGLHASQQHPIQVNYEGVIVGDYLAYILVEECVVLELKSIKSLDETHMAQCMNYLKATGLHVCLLLNFGNNRLQVKRIVHNLPDPNEKVAH